MRFKISENYSLKDAIIRMPLMSSVSANLFEYENEEGVIRAAEEGVVEIVDVPKFVKGEGDEFTELIRLVPDKRPPILQGWEGRVEGYAEKDVVEYVFIKPTGEELKILYPGWYECLRCGHTTFIPQKIGEPEQEPQFCSNETCARRGPFKRNSPQLFMPFWRVPPYPKELHHEILFEEIVKFFQAHAKYPHDTFYYCDAALVMATWVHEKMQSFPIRINMGETETGKSRSLELLALLSYHGIITSHIKPAALARIAEKYRASIFVDEAEMQLDLNTEKGRDLYGILNSRYRRGTYYVKSSEKNERDVVVMDLFGFSGLSSTRSFLPTLESRGIILYSLRGTPKNPIVDMKWVDKLLSHLLWFRFTHTHIINWRIPDLPGGRLREIYAPIYTILMHIGKREVWESIADFVIKVWERKKEEGANPEETYLWNFLREIGDKAIYLRDLATLLDSCLGGGDKYTSKKIGYILRKMGFTPRKEKHGYIINMGEKEHQDRLEELRNIYYSSIEESNLHIKQLDLSSLE